MIENLERIVRVVDIPATIDIEAGYVHTPIKYSANNF